MRRRVAVFLAVAAAAVALENVLYLRASSPPTGAAEEAEAEPVAEATESSALAAVCEDAVHDYLAALADPGRARSAFLTRAEADALAAAEPARDAGTLHSLVLDGTLVSADRRIAWLDGIASTEGDQVGAFELIRIEPRAVVLRSGADQVRIELREPAAKELEP